MLGETRIPGGLLEPVDGGIEVAGGIVDISDGIPGRGGIVGEGHLLHRKEPLAGVRIVHQRIVAVSALEHVLGDLLAHKVILGEGSELPAGTGIIPCVEKRETLLETHLR